MNSSSVNLPWKGTETRRNEEFMLQCFIWLSSAWFGKAVGSVPSSWLCAELCGEPRPELAGGLQGRRGEHGRAQGVPYAEVVFTSRETDELFQAVVSRLNDAIPLSSVMYVLINRRLMNLITR